MMTTQNYKILAKYIKDMSSETPDIETYFFVKDYISKYQLKIDIVSKALKDKLIEINTVLKFQDERESEKKSHFEIVFATIIKVEDKIKEKKDFEKIILCDVQKEIYPKLEKIFLNIIKDSGFPNIKFTKKIDFENLYNKKLN